MVTFERARVIVEAYEAATWRADRDGTLYVAPGGYEDAEGYLVIVGARELLVDGDQDYLTLDDRAVTVEKATGEVFELDALRDAPRLLAMTPTR